VNSSRVVSRYLSAAQHPSRRETEQNQQSYERSKKEQERAIAEKIRKYRGQDILDFDEKGNPVFWPKVTGFDGYASDPDRYGFVSEMTYEAQGGLHVTVVFDYSAYKRPPHSWKVDAAPLKGKLKGSWKSLKDVSRSLQGALTQYKAHLEEQSRKARESLQRLAGSNWDYNDAGLGSGLEEVVYSRKNDFKYSDAHLDVTLDDVADVISGDSDRGEYRVSFSQGSDYMGHYGEKKLHGTWKSVDDVKKILADAEKLWKKETADAE